MGDCCNSDQVQQSFGEMTSSVKELLIRTSSALTEILSNITQHWPGAGTSSDHDSQENKPQTFKQYFWQWQLLILLYSKISLSIAFFAILTLTRFVVQTSDWTEIVTTTLLVAHIAFLILFFCSRSLIAPFKE